MNSQVYKKNKLPSSPGVYLFKKGKGVLYVGKATSLKDRVKSYFSKDLIATRGPILVDMVFKSDKLEFEQTDSVLEALILEAHLIKKFQPKYNTKEKDNKSYNYVVITDEPFPKVLIERGKNIDFKKLQTTHHKLQTTYGPFPHGAILKEALRIVRKIFPFIDRQSSKKDNYEFYRQLGLVPDVSMSFRRRLNLGRDPNSKAFQNFCEEPKQKVEKVYSDSRSGNSSRQNSNWSHESFSTEKSLDPDSHRRAPSLKLGPIPISTRLHGNDRGDIVDKDAKLEYKKTIRNIKLFFEGKKKELIRKLEKEMHTYAKAQKFEEANKIKKTIYALNHIHDVSLLKRDMADVGKALRIEAYDVAHLSGTNMVGVMVVIEDGIPEKDEYRKFNIKTVKGANDPASLKEMFLRRLGHTEWQYPGIIVVDGNEIQLNVVEQALKTLKITIPVVAVVKDEKHKASKILGEKNLILSYRNQILLANSEAHRFALAFHRQKRGKLK
jgi:excinuclease ABC subunit C